jgi:hypothetical protein
MTKHELKNISDDIIAVLTTNYRQNRIHLFHRLYNMPILNR